MQTFFKFIFRNLSFYLQWFSNQSLFCNYFLVRLVAVNARLFTNSLIYFSRTIAEVQISTHAIYAIFRRTP